MILLSGLKLLHLKLAERGISLQKKDKPTSNDTRKPSFGESKLEPKSP